MIAKGKRLLTQFRKAFRQDKLGVLLLCGVFFFELLFMTSVPLLSGMSRFHQIPLLLCGIQCAFMIVWICLRGRFFVDAPIVAILLFVIYDWLSCLWGFPTSSAVTITLLSILCIISYIFLTVSRKIRLYFVVWGLALILFSIAFIVVYRNELIHLNFDRLGSYFNNENNIATFFAIGVLFSALLLTKKKWWALCPFSLFSFLGLTTGSRSFLFATVIILITAIALFFGKKRWYFSLLTIFVFAGIVFATLYLPVFSGIRTRLAALIGAIFGGNSDGSTSERGAMILEGLSLWLSSPFFGNGHEAFRNLSYFGTYSHNTLAEGLCNYGLIGTAIFLSPSLYLFRVLRPKNKTNPFYAHLIILFLILLVIEWFSGVAFGEKNHYLILGAALSVARFDEPRCLYSAAEISFDKTEKKLRLALRVRKPTDRIATDFYTI